MKTFDDYWAGVLQEINAAVDPNRPNFDAIISLAKDAFQNGWDAGVFQSSQASSHIIHGIRNPSRDLIDLELQIRGKIMMLATDMSEFK